MPKSKIWDLHFGEMNKPKVQYFIKGSNGILLGPYANKKDVESILHQGDMIVRRKKV